MARLREWFVSARRAVRRAAATFALRWRTLSAPVPLDLRGERAVARLLQRRGLIVVRRRERTKYGELDLVAVDRRARRIHFVEVKTRRSDELGPPGERVDADKERRIVRAALGFLKRHRLLDCAVRFDVASVVWPDDAPQPRIDYFESAFAAPPGLGFYG